MRLHSKWGEWALCLPFFLLIFYHVDHSRTSHYNVGRSDYMSLPAEMEEALRGKRIIPCRPAQKHLADVRGRTPSQYPRAPTASFPISAATTSIISFRSFRRSSPGWRSPPGGNAGAGDQLDSGARNGFSTRFFRAPRDESIEKFPTKDVLPLFTGGSRRHGFRSGEALESGRCPPAGLFRKPFAASPKVGSDRPGNLGGARESDGQSDLVVNFFARPHMIARLSGKPLEMMPYPWGRVRVRLPRGEAGKLEVNYEGPWAAGWGAGLIAALAAGGLLFAKLAGTGTY